MDNCREWTRTLLPASFKGIGFEVETDGVDGGRRLVVHEYPGAEHWDVEDLGAARQGCELTCYFGGDTADDDSRRFAEACWAGGAGLLALPFWPARRAYGMRASRTSRRSALGYFEVRASFVYAAASRGGLVFRQWLPGALSAAIGGAVLQIEASFTAAYNSLILPNVAREAAAVTVRLAAEALAEAAAVVGLDRKAAARIGHDIQLLGLDAYWAARQGQGRNTVTELSVALTQRIVDGTLGRRIAAVFATLAAATDKNLLASRMDRLTGFTAQPVYGPAGLASVAAELDLTGRVARLVRVLALLRWAEAKVRDLPPTRDRAVALRGRIADRFAAELDSTLDAAEYEALVAARDAAIRFLSENGADLPATTKAELPRSYPAVVLAYEVFGDAGRAADLIRRNGVAHPHFVDGVIEVLLP